MKNGTLKNILVILTVLNAGTLFIPIFYMLPQADDFANAASMLSLLAEDHRGGGVCGFSEFNKNIYGMAGDILE